MKHNFRNYFQKYIRLLQLENYDLRRYGRILLQKRKKNASSKITWTAKLALVVIAAVASMILLQVLAFLLFFPLLKQMGSMLLFSVMIFLWLGLTIVAWGFFLLAAAAFLSPFDRLIKFQIIRRAQKKIKNHPDLQIIAITGSYGKSTMKEVVSQFMAEKYQVLKTPENINTPLGVARLIMKKLTAETELFVVEMGAFYPHDIRDLCRLTPPHISILTGINESHLERFGRLENTIKTKFEIVTCARPDAFVLLNHDDENIRKNYGKFIGGKQYVFYGRSKSEKIPYTVNNIRHSAEDLQTAFDFKGKNNYHFQIPFLGDYMLGTIMAGVLVAEQLQIPVRAIENAARLLKPLAHRLQAMKTDQDIIIIDDSYNGNPEGVKEALKALGGFSKRRKIYITPGLVEMGGKSAEIHRQIGCDLAKTANMVLLVRNSVTGFIAEGLRAENFPKKNLFWFEKREQAHQAIRGIIRPGDVLMFQNDWPENYF